MTCRNELGFINVKKCGNDGNCFVKLRSIDDISVACFGVGVASVGGKIERWSSGVAWCVIVWLYGKDRVYEEQ